MAKEPNLKDSVSKEMKSLQKTLDKLDKILEKRIEFEEDTYSLVSPATMDTSTLIGRLRSHLHEFSHLI